MQKREINREGIGICNQVCIRERTSIRNHCSSCNDNHVVEISNSNIFFSSKKSNKYRTNNIYFFTLLFEYEKNGFKVIYII